MKNLVPLSVFLRRNPNLAAIQTAVAETVATGTSLTSVTPKTDRVIRTVPITMTDGRIHGVHVWCGPTNAEPPERPIPGPLKWDMTLGVATDTVKSLVNEGLDPTTESTNGRAFVEDIPWQDPNPDEAKVLALTIDAAPNRTYSTTWSFTDKQGNFHTVGFVARTGMEVAEDGSQHLVGRAMNLPCETGGAKPPPTQLAQRILDGLSQPGVYRALVDLADWNLLKWLDEPCPHYDWRAKDRSHPDDKPLLVEMTKELQTGATSRVLRLPGIGGGWVPMHVTINRVEVDENVYAGLITLRLPTDAELADAKLVGAGGPPPS